MTKRIVALDVECYTNYFLCICKSPDGRIDKFSQYDNRIFEGDKEKLRAILREHLIVTFNGKAYDLPIIAAFLGGYTNQDMKALSDQIIVGDEPFWRISDQHPKVRVPRTDHIDLIGVTPLKASLKTYMCRLHAPKMQDLPIHPDQLIKLSDTILLETYCENDVDGTLQIYNTLLPQIQLREDMTPTYNTDMRSMSDPQIAEAAIRKMMTDSDLMVDKRETKVKPFTYDMPEFITFSTPELQAVKAMVERASFKVKPSGHAELPEELNKAIPFEGAMYKLGIGGIHSQEKQQVVIPAEDEIMGELDVASMYPSIILGQNLHPEHLDPKFCDLYRRIFDERLAAKANGNRTTADTLKIVLNASYGKFGSQYSFLYSPELLVQTTLSGQLSLLMLIERLHGIGVKVVSANTDGVVILAKKTQWDAVQAIADNWTKDTTYVLEWTEYDAIYSRDVNSYLAFKGSEVKTKGTYEYGSIRKGYATEVCLDAVVAYLRDNTDIATSIHQCSDVTKFLTMRGVRGSGVWRGKDLGKVVRWYNSTDGEPITYKTNGNKVAGSDGAKPLMDLPTSLPDDIDYDWYIARTHKLITDLGVIL